MAGFWREILARRRHEFTKNSVQHVSYISWALSLYMGLKACAHDGV